MRWMMVAVVTVGLVGLRAARHRRRSLVKRHRLSLDACALSATYYRFCAAAKSMVHS